MQLWRTEVPWLFVGVSDSASNLLHNVESFLLLHQRVGLLAWLGVLVKVSV
jgi:hypothetical protein